MIFGARPRPLHEFLSSRYQSLSTKSSHAKVRDIAIRYAVLTALLSRGGGTALQLVAMPFVVRQLGLVAFGEYSTAVAAFSWVLLGETVIGQAMVGRLVLSARTEDANAATAAICTGLATAGLLASIVGVLFSITWVAMALMQKWTIEKGTIILYIAAGLISVFKLFLTVTSRARSAFQQTHVDNVYNALANVGSFAAVFLLLPLSPKPSTLLLVLFLPPLAAQLASAVQMFATNTLLTGVFRVDLVMAREFLGESWWLFLGQIGIMSERQLPLIVFSLASYSAIAAQYAIAIQLTLMAASPVTMITIPLIPAMTHAMHNDDHSWWVRRVRVLDRIITIGGCITMVFALLKGPAVLHLLFGSAEIFSGFECAALTGWIMAVLSALIYFSVLMAKGEAAFLGKSSCVKGCVFALLGFLAFTHQGFGGLFTLGMILTWVITREPWRRRVRALELLYLRRIGTLPLSRG